MSERDVHGMRAEYVRHELQEADASSDPVEQFARWFDEARASNVVEPNAMILATVDADGAPKARTMLLKQFDEAGFVFFTNYESDKGRQLAADPRAALCFWWPGVERQVRVEGAIEKVADSESDAYFRERPRESQIGALVSKQSAVVPSREVLDEAYDDALAEYDGRDVPRPAFWGGYRVVPRLIEFWQGRRGRLHDRLRYVRADGAWRRERLSP